MCIFMSICLMRLLFPPIQHEKHMRNSILTSTPNHIFEACEKDDEVVVALITAKGQYYSTGQDLTSGDKLYAPEDGVSLTDHLRAAIDSQAKQV